MCCFFTKYISFCCKRVIKSFIQSCSGSFFLDRCGYCRCRKKSQQGPLNNIEGLRSQFTHLSIHSRVLLQCLQHMISGLRTFETIYPFRSYIDSLVIKVLSGLTSRYFDCLPLMHFYMPCSARKNVSHQPCIFESYD